MKEPALGEIDVNSLKKQKQPQPASTAPMSHVCSMPYNSQGDIVAYHHKLPMNIFELA
jgi:hypothetical protein